MIAYICIFGTVVGLAMKDSNVWGSFLFALGVDILLGFGMIANVGAWGGTQTEIIVPDEIAKSQYTMFVTCQGQTYQTSDIKLFTAPESSIRVIRAWDINAYGNKINFTRNELTLLEENQ